MRPPTNGVGGLTCIGGSRVVEGQERLVPVSRQAGPGIRATSPAASRRVRGHTADVAEATASKPPTRAWPSFAWCGSDPLSLCVPNPADDPPIPPLLDATADDSLLPPVERPEGAGEVLLPVEMRRVRVIGAYWHTGWPFARAGAYLRERALHRLGAAAAALPAGFGVAVWDAWRDPRLQECLHDAAYSDPNLPPGFVSPPSTDPQRPPPHATGGTVDLTLTWHHVPLALGTQFDAFVPDAHAGALESVTDDEPAALSRNLRRLLRARMVAAGFVQLNCEWWHFEYGTRLWAAVRGEPVQYGSHQGPPRR